eukprot:jgi/Mesen1/10004/ME000722S09289
MRIPRAAWELASRAFAMGPRAKEQVLWHKLPAVPHTGPQQVRRLNSHEVKGGQLACLQGGQLAGKPAVQWPKGLVGTTPAEVASIAASRYCNQRIVAIRRQVLAGARGLSTSGNASEGQGRRRAAGGGGREVARQPEEGPFDEITDRIPERPVSVAEGASYSLVILAGVAVAGAALYAVFKELLIQPKEYTVFNKALDRVKTDNQVTVRLGSPVKGYGQESRNRAARQRISHRVYTDEDGGAGIVQCEMFKDKVDRQLKYTYLIVDITAPTPTRLMLESYIPAPVNL